VTSKKTNGEVIEPVSWVDAFHDLTPQLLESAYAVDVHFAKYEQRTYNIDSTLSTHFDLQAAESMDAVEWRSTVMRKGKNEKQTLSEHKTTQFRSSR
jgi:hypothetical protein